MQDNKINLVGTMFDLIASEPVFLTTSKQPVEVYFFFGRDNDVLCINRDTNKVEYKIEDLDQINISITSKTEFSVRAKNGEPLFLHFGGQKDKPHPLSGGQSQGAQGHSQTQTTFKQNNESRQLETEEIPIVTVSEAEYPNIAKCQNCSGKRCGSYDALNGSKFIEKGRTLTEATKLQEYETYCGHKIEQFNCSL